ncbi:hypothetical protein [Helcococcus kunzii]|uniref:hypothetical protein n=1 Tax=Helcococcus kunzii TaxID=40091 RepID=UPI0024AD4927|nr:hypothetical protein [Helcococcus kunzii]
MALLNVNDVMKILRCKETKAYGIIKDLNKELELKGYYTIRGKIEEKYLKERFRINN